MISEIIAKNFVMFKNIDVKFKNGLNVITGETGAGKSLIIKLIDILSGNKATTESIRFGEEECVIQGVFGKNEEIIVTRIINAKSRNNIKLNELRVTLKELQDAIKNHIYVHTQNKQYQLLNPKYIYKLLSLYSEDVQNAENDYKNSYNLYKSIEKEIEDVDIDPQELNRKMDILNYQINEIESASLSEGEEEKIKTEYRILNNFEKIDMALNKSKEYINEDDLNIIDKLSELIKDLSEVSDIDEKLQNFANRLNNVSIELQDVLDDMDRYLSEIEYDRDKLSFYEDRLNTIYSLKNKYGNSVEEILEYLKRIKVEYSKLSTFEDEKNKLNERLKKAYEEAKNKALTLSELRKKYAKELEKGVSELLPDLGMSNAAIRFDFEKTKNMTPNGVDTIKLKIRTNIGEPYKDYNSVISGGELSRLMLAFELNIKNSILADTLVFDEIDTGIGGKTAIKLGKKLKELTTRGYQIILVTHLPQIAVFADNHIKIEKFVKDGRTYSDAKILNREQIDEEIERMRILEVRE